MKKIYYEKVGRKYVPVREYDSDFLDSFPKGAHIIITYPGGKSTRYNIDPDYAGLIAASRVMEDALSKAIHRASEMRPHNKPITEEQKTAWEALSKAFDNDRYYIEIPSAREIAEEGVKALQEEAKMLYSNEAVKKAYDHFVLMCKLTKEENAKS